MNAEHARAACSRRRFLTGVGYATAATAAGALLAACGNDDVARSVDAASIPVGGAVVVDPWIVAQPKEGTFVAYSTVCPHARGKIDRLSTFNGETVAICSKHHSQFAVSDGAVLDGPSRDPMTPAHSVEKEGDAVTVS